MWLRLLLASLLTWTIPAAQAAEDPLQAAENLLQAQRTQPDTAQFERAKGIAAAAVKRAPAEARGWTLLAWAHMLEHRFFAALDAAKTADRLAPDDPRTLALMDDALVELGRYDEAVTVAQRLADLDPGVPTWIRVARLRFLHNDLDGAIQLLTAAARAGRPQGEASAWVWLELARMHLYVGDRAAASQAIAAAQHAYPRLPAILPLQARLQLVQGNHRAALGLYQQALTAQPAAEEALLAWRLARQLGKAGRAKQYAALLEGLARLDTGGLSRRALAEYWAETGQHRRALDMARQEFAARPDLYSHATLARVLQLAGNAPEAQHHAQAALTLNTPDPQLRTDMRAILAPLAAAQTEIP
jgi:tetratricopeptide (TPR) repeat protein